MNATKHLTTIIRNEFPEARLDMDAPDDPVGRWFLDVVLDEYHLVVEWRENAGFGLSASGTDAFGEKPEEAYEDEQDAIRRVF